MPVAPPDGEALDLFLPPLRTGCTSSFYLQRGTRAGQVCLFSWASSGPGQGSEEPDSFCSWGVSLGPRTW